jgi:integrating conjugative element protein (TIGR03755 family)
MKSMKNRKNRGKKHMKKIGILSLTSLVLVCVTPLWALNMVPANSHYYYSLNGGSAVSMSPVTKQHEIKVGGGMNSNLGFTCSGFNPAISMQNYLNNMQNSVEGLDRDVLGSLTAAVGSAPMLGLEKANPELYNLFQNAMTHGEDRFHLSMQDCQGSLAQIKNGKSPYEDWFSVSDSQGWLNYAKAAEKNQPVDINNATQAMTKNRDQYGVPWVHQGQNSGGTQEAQAPIRVIYDIVVAGYNVLVDSNRALDDPSAPPEASSDLTRYWKKPSEAGEWAELVLGDVTISSRTHADDTHPGVGLTTLLQICPPSANNALTCTKTIKEKLVQLVAQSGYPTAEELQAVSSEEVMITPDVILAIRNKTKEEQAISVQALAENVAIQNLTNEGLMLRRILIAGSQTKPVHNLNPALIAVQRTLNELDQDIKNSLFEQEIRQKMMMNTVKTILNSEENHKAKALSAHEETEKPLMKEGAIYKNEGESL